MIFNLKQNITFSYFQHIERRKVLSEKEKEEEEEAGKNKVAIDSSVSCKKRRVRKEFMKEKNLFE